MDNKIIQDLKDYGFPLIPTHQSVGPNVQLNDGNYYLVPQIEDIINACGEEPMVIINGPAIKQVIGLKCGFVNTAPTLFGALAGFYTNLQK